MKPITLRKVILFFVANALFIVIFIAVSCSPFRSRDLPSQATTATPHSLTTTQKGQINDAPNSTITVSATVSTVAPTHTPIPPTSIGFLGLQNGEYILSKIGNSLIAISLDTQEQTALLKGENGDMTLLADNENLMLVPVSGKSPYMINLTSEVRTDLSFLRGCNDISLSPEGKYYLGTCAFKENSLDIYLFSVDGKQVVQLTNCKEQQGFCSKGFFSPDGKWISYIWQPAGALQSKRTGLYLVKSSCISSQNKCGQMSIGPFNVAADYIWAPNSILLASSGDKTIRLFKLENETIINLRELDGTPARFSNGFLTWSPNSSQLAFTTGPTIMVINITGGKSQYLKGFDQDAYLIRWVPIVNGKISH
jgi:WD40 repeat protein